MVWESQAYSEHNKLNSHIVVAEKYAGYQVATYTPK
jgi:hypothetical protein